MAKTSLHRSTIFSTPAFVIALSVLAPVAATGCSTDPGGDGETATGSTDDSSTSSTGAPASTGAPTEPDSSGGSTTSDTTGGQVQTPFEQAVDAIGGADALTDLQLLQIDAEGTRRFPYEAPTPGDVTDVSAYDDTYTFDVANDNFRATTERTPLFEVLAAFPSENFDVVLNGDVGGLSAPAGFMMAGALPSEVVGAYRAQQRLLNPHLLLREGVEDPSIVGEAGMEDIDGVPHRIATLAGDVAEIRLFVNEDTGVITKLETMENNILVRDVAVEVQYGDWASQGALAFPSTVELSIDGQSMIEETRTGFQLEPKLGEGYFDLPPEAGRPAVNDTELTYGRQTEQTVDAFFHLGFAFPEQPPFQSLPLAPGVTLLAGQTNIVVVSYDEGLIVLEAPITPAHGVNVLDTLALEFPGSAVTHIIQSHHHQDHAGGARSFVAEGATLVVGAGVASFWEETLDAPSTVRPDQLSQTDVTPVIEEIPDGGTFSRFDADITVTAHHLPDSEHSEDMVITVIDVAGTRLVYVADLYNAGLGGTLVLGGPEEFFGALRELGIIDAACNSAVPLTIVPSHGFPQSLADSLAEVAGLGHEVGC